MNIYKACKREDASRAFKFTQTVTLALLFGLFCLPNSAVALGFGTPVIESHLNQPLKGYVPLLLAGSENIKQIKVELATPDEYRRLGLQWHKSMASIRVLLPRGSTEAKVELSSVGAVKFPMLSIVLKARKTGRGTYFRHFRILLDPVYISLPGRTKPQVSPVQSTAETQPPAETKDDSGWARVWRYGPVRSGDSLSEIAYRLRKDKRWSNRQVMLSLYEENPGSFINQDIHRLKSGAWLSVPDAEVVKKNGSKSAMIKLNGLMRNKASTRADGANVETATPAVAKEYPSQELRYSGLISVKRAVGSREAEKGGIAPASSESLADLQTIHAQVMSSKLQMDNLGRTVEGLGKSMAGLKMDMKALRQEVAAIHEAPAELKQEIQSLRQEVAGIKEALPEMLQAMSVQTSAATDDAVTQVQKGVDAMVDSLPPAIGEPLKNYWAVAFFVLLIACLGFLIGSTYQRRTSRTWKEPAAVEPTGAEPAVAKPAKPSSQAEASPVVQAPQPEVSADQKNQCINEIEESLSQCEYEQAEQSLLELDKLAPDSLKASVLWAQLYHETARTEQRDMLISTICEDSDESRWERFCYLLPSHVWNACFGDGDATVEQPSPDRAVSEQK